MADSPEKTDDSAEKAYAAASSEVKKAQAKAAPADDKSDVVDIKAVKEAVQDEKPAPAAKEAPNTKPVARKAVAKKKAPAKEVVAKKATPARKPSEKAQSAAKAKPVPKKTAIKVAAAKRKPATVQKRAAVREAATTTAPSITELKEKIMATQTTDFTDTMSKSMTDAVADMQFKAQAAYDKSTAAMAEMTDLAKGNVEAMVETGKIVAGGMQNMGKTYVDEAKTAYETMTADMKEMAAIKSPTELFQLQGKIMRRNFDAFVATASKNSEAAMKLANDAAAPMTGRMNVAAEKLSKVA